MDVRPADELSGYVALGELGLDGSIAPVAGVLPAALHAAIPEIGGHASEIVMHNDAVVQGLSEVPFMQDVAHWAVLTIGTGLGNARFTNRHAAAAAKKMVHLEKGEITDG